MIKLLKQQAPGWFLVGQEDFKDKVTLLRVADGGGVLWQVDYTAGTLAEAETIAGQFMSMPVAAKADEKAANAAFLRLLAGEALVTYHVGSSVDATVLAGHVKIVEDSLTRRGMVDRVTRTRAEEGGGTLITVKGKVDDSIFEDFEDGVQDDLGIDVGIERVEQKPVKQP